MSPFAQRGRHAHARHYSAGRAIRTARVRVGDILMVKDNGYPVRRIVPPDEKTGVIGWLELGSRPVDDAELKKRADRVVRPSPKPSAK